MATGTHSAIIPTPFGKLALYAEEDNLLALCYVPPNSQLKAPTDALLLETQRQLELYFKQPSYHFHLPLKPQGSMFQQRVWHAISMIGVGQTQTYGALAQQLNTSPRAIGRACGTNPFPLIVPCHRVVAAHGLGGFAQTSTTGYLLAIKRWLLMHEQQPA